jgi:hypothetical protein
MKTVKGFLASLKKNPVISGAFGSVEDVFAQFEENPDANIQIVYAHYEQDTYDGSAIVFFYDKATKRYFEVHGSHCSCYGLENQWSPSAIEAKALELRLKDGYFYDGGELKRRFEDFKAK